MDFSKGLKEIEEFLAPLSLDGKPLSKKERESAYSIAFGKYQVGEYEEAADLFTHLILHSPFEGRFWRGLASSRQMEQSYKDALKAWAILCLLEGHPPEAYFHAAECYLSIGDMEEAKKTLLYAKERLSEVENGKN